jgi:hypothetical protein
MEHGIYFENENANETILAALEEFNDIFFVENSSSESEKNTSEDEETALIISDDENFENFDEIDLNTNFEFVKNSDNYIEDKVYDNLKLKVKKFFKNGKCSCKTNKCYKKIGYEQFFERRAGFESLDKNIRDIVIKGNFWLFKKMKIRKKPLLKIENLYVSTIITMMIFQFVVLHIKRLLELVINI